MHTCASWAFMILNYWSAQIPKNYILQEEIYKGKSSKRQKRQKMKKESMCERTITLDGLTNTWGNPKFTTNNSRGKLKTLITLDYL